MKHKHYRKKFSFLLLGLFLGLTVSGQTITKEFTKTSLKDVLKEIERQTGLSVIYEKSDINENKSITETFTATPVEKVLPRILDATADFTIQNKMIVLFKKKLQEPALSSANDSKIVSGMVVDVGGEPVIGANVVEKGASNGTATDANGKFSLDVSPGATLVISYIGYMKREIAVGNQTNIKVNLVEDLQALEELVVVGYGTMSKSHLTGAVASVKSEQLITRPVASVGQALSGQVAGVDVGEITTVGSTPSIVIRGYRSINFSKSPLYVVDGIPRDTYTDIPVSDIQSVEVLKDAISTAIYGSRAANGVILI
ncbi:MAG: TonB-dependent receptor plug domain-containing protein, partial [Tannerella sp.]|nr:TonB-dependent receptor plug domain-containing protein [Tannerella sp.]